MLSTEIIKKSNWVSYIKVLIMIIIVLGIGSLQPFGSITPLGMKALGIFIGALYGWCLLDTLWVSIFAIIAVGYTCSSVIGALGTGFSSQIALMALAATLVGGALDSCKITDLLCNWCLTRKIIKGRPWVLVSMILIIAALIGAFASIIAGTFILWMVILKLADMLSLIHIWYRRA